VAEGPVVVIGVGNPDRGDDGVGPVVAGMVAEACAPGVTAVADRGDPAVLMDRWDGASLAVLVDAMVSGCPPGAVERFDATVVPLPASMRLASTHSVGAGEAVELARALGRLPDRLVVYGIEVVSFAPGAQLTGEVADGARLAAGMVCEEVAGA